MPPQFVPATFPQVEGVPFLIEQAVNEIKDRLRTQLNNTLDTVFKAIVSSDRTISFERVPDNRYYISEAIEALQPPAVFIIADRSTHDLRAQNFAAQTHSILVALITEDVEVQRLQRKVWRYGQALYMVLHDAPLWNGDGRVLVRTVDYGPTGVLKMPGSQSVSARTFRKDVTLHCDVLHYEAYTLQW